MGEPDALSRLVLGSRAPEQVENALMVLGIDAAPVVADLKHGKAELGSAADRDLAGNSGLQIFDRVVDQVGEDLLQRQPVADDVGQRRDVDFGLGLLGLVRQRRDDRLRSVRAYRSGPARTRAVPSRVRLRIAEISRSILAIEDLMKPSASVKSSESCLSSPSSAGSASAASDRHAAAAAAWPSAAMRRKMSVAQFLELAGEAHDVHQRRAQIVADDIGEALDFVVGLAQIGGALVDGGFEIDVVVAQPRLRPRRARALSRRTRKIEMPASAMTRPEPAIVTVEASFWLRSALSCSQRRAAGFPRRAWRRRRRGWSTWCRPRPPRAPARSPCPARPA